MLIFQCLKTFQLLSVPKRKLYHVCPIIIFLILFKSKLSSSFILQKFRRGYTPPEFAQGGGGVMDCCTPLCPPLSRSMIRIQIYDWYPNVWFVSKSVIHIQNCDWYPELWFVSRNVGMLFIHYCNNISRTRVCRTLYLVTLVVANKDFISNLKGNSFRNDNND